MADDLASALAAELAAGERAAFHGPPRLGIDALGRAVDRAGEHGLAAEAAAARWLLAVCQAAAGRYGQALAAVEPLLPVAPDAPAETRVFGALAEASTASVHRQLGRHAEARAHDEVALALSGGTGEAGFDAALGLAADAVGLGEAAVARGHRDAAAGLLGEHAQWWRQRVRLGWVEAEIAMLEGDPATAVGTAAASVELAEHSGAPRHVAKGLLFEGVALLEAGRPEEAATTLRRGGLLAESLGTLPLLWPARAVLGALVSGADPAESERALGSARRAVEEIAADLPPALREGWLTRADVAALLTG